MSAAHRLAHLLEATRVERPAEPDEIVEVVRQAASRGHSLLPVGGATACWIAPLPGNVDVVLDTTALCATCHIDAANFTAFVPAGMTVSALQESAAVRDAGCMAALDPFRPQHATLGGVYAANLSGPLRLGYGTIRDQVLGISAVDPQGRRFKAGGQTVKNVAGYDLTKFFIGSAGRLCIVTGLCLRLFPQPPAAALIEARFGETASMLGMWDALWTGRVTPAAAVGYWLPKAAGVVLAVAVTGNAAAVDRLAAGLTGKAREHGGRTTVQQGWPAVRTGLEAAFHPRTAGAGWHLVLSVPPEHECVTVADLWQDPGPAGGPVWLSGSGVVHLHPRHEAMARLYDRATHLEQTYGARLSLLEAPIRPPAELAAGLARPADAAAVSALKTALDPRATLPPTGAEEVRT